MNFDLFYIINRILLKRSQQNDIEIPYNCGGVLANILSDGPDAWTISSSIEQDVVNQEMYDAVQTWDLRKQRTINYRSLAPLLRLLNENYPSGCVMWAVWAMTNLTTVLRMFPYSLFRRLDDKKSWVPCLSCSIEYPDFCFEESKCNFLKIRQLYPTR